MSFFSPRTALIPDENKTALIPDEKSHGLARHITRINMQKNVVFRRFWVKEPRDSGNIFAKKRYTSIPLTTILG